MSVPTVPPRPTRANAGPTAVKANMPQVPPRPIRNLDLSPARDDYNRSPLNDLPSGYRKPSSRSASRGPTDVPSRPPSVSLPSIGQEGSEYSSYDQLPPEALGVRQATPQQTRNVSATMPLHAPKASVPDATAQSRIETVTSTDSTQAAAAGIGRSQPEDDVHRTPNEAASPLRRVPSRTDYHIRRVSSTEPNPLGQRAFASRSTPSLPTTTAKAASVHEIGHEHGIPEIGRQIPLNPYAGDAQAPNEPTMSLHAPGIGYFNDGSARAAGRRKSLKHSYGPPDSYGLHGHGLEPQDQFERDWAAKHPKEAAMEGYNAYGHFHVPRPSTALSTDDLNKLVNQSSDNGMGTSNVVVGTPSWEIANQATAEYVSKFLPLTADRPKRSSDDSQPNMESPLRHSISAPATAGLGGFAEAIEDDGTIHVDEPERNLSHVAGGGPVDGAIDLGPRAGNTAERGGWIEERGPGTPILASDEVLKRRSSAYMHPAISPELRPADEYYDSDHGYDSRRSSLHVPSRPSSRPNSVHGSYHGGNLHRFISHEEHYGSGVHTPLEEIEEYEPLFPEEEQQQLKPKPKSSVKRSGLEHHHFPSQDVWEDTPLSLQYQTTVLEPELPHEEKLLAAAEAPAATFETPEAEQRRRALNPDSMLSESKMVKKPQFKSGVQSELERPGLLRFPSSDIWEDTPDTLRLETTVSGPQMDDLKSPPDEQESEIFQRPSSATLQPAAAAAPHPVRPSIPARPQRKSRLAEELTPETVDAPAPEEEDEGATTLEKQASPPQQAPQIPDRSKPTIPARPTRANAAPEAATDANAAAAQAKPKPVVPARHVGEKIAALKAGFMNDLNQRLKLGPQGPPAPSTAKAVDSEPGMEEAEAAAPLADARKSRAKGPARRRPATTAAAETDSDAPQGGAASAFSFSAPLTLWHIDHETKLHVLPTHHETDEEAIPQDTSALDPPTSSGASAKSVTIALPPSEAGEQSSKVIPCGELSAEAHDADQLPAKVTEKLEEALQDNVAKHATEPVPAPAPEDTDAVEGGTAAQE